MRVVIFLGFVVICSHLRAASINFSGSIRNEGTVYQNLNLGAAGAGPSKQFIMSRALLEPKILIDDHFSFYSQWNILTSNNYSPNATQALGMGQGGFLFGDPTTTSLVLSRAWLEWISDFGVVRIGRMPFSFGYGLVWDGGNNLWDDFQTTLDRLEYRLHLGHFIGAVAYSKGRKLSTLGNDNDQEFYSIFLRYDNPEQEVESGLIYEKQSRSTNQQTDLMSGSGNPYRYQRTGPAVTYAPLNTQSSSPLVANVLGGYVKKSVGGFTFGFEGNWITGTATDYGNDGNPDDLNAFGMMANVTYELHKVKGFVDFLYASGDDDLSGKHLYGFTILHRNRRPGLILGRELLGNYYNGDYVAQGGLVYYGTAGTFSGAYYVRPGFRIDWSPSWNTGLEVIVAQKAAVRQGENAHLGVEIDLGAEHAFYKNFDIGFTAAYLIPGAGLQSPGLPGAYGFRAQASVKF